MAETDKVNNKVIVAAVVLTGALLVALVVGVYQWFHFAVHSEMQRKVYSLQSAQLRELRAEDQAKTNRYQWVDQTAGVVRIPTERAMELILSEGYKRPTPAPAEGAKH